jgi:hypothetical protein
MMTKEEEKRLSEETDAIMKATGLRTFVCGDKEITWQCNKCKKIFKTRKEVEQCEAKKMNKYEELASAIIDIVCDVVELHYPKLKPKVLSKDDVIDDPALLNGEVYYNLESEIADLLKKNMRVR